MDFEMTCVDNALESIFNRQRELVDIGQDHFLLNDISEMMISETEPFTEWQVAVFDALADCGFRIIIIDGNQRRLEVHWDI